MDTSVGKDERGWMYPAGSPLRPRPARTRRRPKWKVVEEDKAKTRDGMILGRCRRRGCASDLILLVVIGQVHH
jgi:hypothetical protein